jgi:hypothetical protein
MRGHSGAEGGRGFIQDEFEGGAHVSCGQMTAAGCPVPPTEDDVGMDGRFPVLLGDVAGKGDQFHLFGDRDLMKPVRFPVELRDLGRGEAAYAGQTCGRDPLFVAPGVARRLPC